MDVRGLAQALPKVDVHCHLLGSIDIDTAVDLARRNDSNIGRSVLEAAYRIKDHDRDDREKAFFEALDMVALLLRTPEDLSRAVYGVVAHGAAASNLRYLELMVNPSALARTGMSFNAIQEGLIDGAKTAESDFGVRTNFIAAVMREEPLSFATEIVDNLIGNRREEFIGIGLDGPEFLDPHRAANFADLYRRAEKHGLKRTAHYCYFGADEYDVYTEGLHCDRIDHGYPVLEDERVLPAIQAGAAGYLLKNTEPAELARAVRAAQAGDAIIDPTVAARLVSALSNDRLAGRDPADQLTRREREVLDLIVHGRSNKRIALELGIAEKTVKTHVGHVLAKLGVTDRTQAALLAVQQGLVSPADHRS